MSQNATSTQINHAKRMRSIGQSNTKPEQIVSHLLISLGARFNTQLEGFPGRPDFASKSEAWIIQVHGCFWHGHDCTHGRIESKTNTARWQEKIAGNRLRDQRMRTNFERLGFLVEEIWECELNDLSKLEKRLEQFLRRARERLEIFTFDLENSVVNRRVSLGHGRSRSTRLVLEHPTVLSPTDAYDLAWLRSSRRPRPARNGTGSISCVDLFSGCGGLSLGVREACEASGRHFRALLAMDQDNNALAVYQKNFSPAIALNGDLASYIDGAIGDAPSASENALFEQLGHLDILVAGPPCQGHSNLNNHTRRNDDRNDLYLRVARFAEIAQPNWIIIENVSSVVHDVRGALKKTREILEAHHYYCDEETIDLSQLGVPQLRKRHILIASKLASIKISKIVENHAHSKARSVLWAIDDLTDRLDTNLLNSARKLSEENYRRINWLFENNAYDLPNELRPRCHHGEHKYYAMYGRLRPHLPANTITTGFGSPGQGRYIHPTRPRTLTAHEAARLQFFPDFFDFSPASSYEALAKMIGNAVPMKLSYLLTLALLRA